MKNYETYLYAFHYDWKFFCFHQFVDAATPLQVVQKELQHISNKQPVLYSKLWIRSMQNAILFHHSDNIRHEDTISNVTKSSLVKVKQLPLQKASQYIPRLSQYISKFEAENVQVYYVAARYEVKRKSVSIKWNELFYASVYSTRGEWRIAESIVAPTDQIVANGDGFGTKQEKEYGKRRENVK